MPGSWPSGSGRDNVRRSSRSAAESRTATSRFSVDGQEFVLRVGGKDTELLGIDRAAEHVASRDAAELGLGPEVVAFVEPEGYLVTRYVDGEVGKVDVGWVGEALRRLHDDPTLPGRFDSFRVVEDVPCHRRAHTASAVPTVYGRLKEIADEIERRRSRRASSGRATTIC